MDITVNMIRDLRERTLAGFTNCKKALIECGGNMEAAVEFLRKKGLDTVNKKSGRATADGLVHSYIHSGGKIGVLLEVNCETDFVAKTDQFKQFVNDVALQIASMAPRYLLPEDVPNDIFEKEKEIRTAQALESGKPEKIVSKIVDGQIKKWYKEICLLEQPFVKENKKTIKDLLNDLIATIGENCKIKRFVRWEVGK